MIICKLHAIIKNTNKKMKNYITIILALFAINLSSSQIAVKGKITDANGVPINGATISYANENSTVKNGTISQEDGNFSFELSETGDYEITVSYIGMKTQSFQKSFNQLKAYDLGNLILQEGLEQLQLVEITGRIRTDYNSDYSFFCN